MHPEHVNQNLMNDGDDEDYDDDINYHRDDDYEGIIQHLSRTCFSIINKNVISLASRTCKSKF